MSKRKSQQKTSGVEVKVLYLEVYDVVNYTHVAINLDPEGLSFEAFCRAAAIVKERLSVRMARPLPYGSNATSGPWRPQVEVYVDKKGGAEDGDLIEKLRQLVQPACVRKVHAHPGILRVQERPVGAYIEFERRDGASFTQGDVKRVEKYADVREARLTPAPPRDSLVITLSESVISDGDVPTVLIMELATAVQCFVSVVRDTKNEDPK